MALLAFVSAKGAPGVTTSVLALAFAWHRPVLVVEADVSGSSSILSGYLRGGTDHTHGLVGLSVAARQHGFTDTGVWEQSLLIGEQQYLLPGIADPSQAPGLTTCWGPLAGVLAGLEEAGVDVLVDAGRLGVAYHPAPLLRAADAVLLVTGTRLPDIYAMARRAPAIVADLAAASDREKAALLVIGEGRPYTGREIQASLGLRVAASIAWDPSNAEVYSDGATPGKRFGTSPLARTAASAAAALRSRVQQRREQLHPGGAPSPDPPGTAPDSNRRDHV